MTTRWHVPDWIKYGLSAAVLLGWCLGGLVWLFATYPGPRTPPALAILVGLAPLWLAGAFLLGEMLGAIVLEIAREIWRQGFIRRVREPVLTDLREAESEGIGRVKMSSPNERFDVDVGDTDVEDYPHRHDVVVDDARREREDLRRELARERREREDLYRELARERREARR